MARTRKPPVIDERYVAVDGNRLHVRIGGFDGLLPPVILEAGGGSTLQTWNGVEQQLAPFMRVLSYERVGIGSSSGRLDSVGAAAVTRRLGALLETTGIRPPVILMGHSLGGLYMRYFAATRPEWVAGLVLLDTTPDDMPIPRLRSIALKAGGLMMLMHGLARLGLLKRIAARRNTSGRSAPITAEQVDAMGRFHHVKAVLTEISALRVIQAEIAALSPITDFPILTISAGATTPGVTPEQFDRFRKSHDQLAAAGRPPNSRHFRVDGATHMSLLTDAQHAKTVAAQVVDFARQITTTATTTA